MARRATVLEGYRREPVPTLTLVGADEFSPDTELPDPAKTGDASPEEMCIRDKLGPVRTVL